MVEMSEMLGLEGECPAGHSKSKFDRCSKKVGKTTVKHSLEKPILLSFVDLYTLVCARLYLINKNSF